MKTKMKEYEHNGITGCAIEMDEIDEEFLLEILSSNHNVCVEIDEDGNDGKPMTTIKWIEKYFPDFHKKYKLLIDKDEHAEPGTIQ